MTDSPTPDAISSAFREAREADPEPNPKPKTVQGQGGDRFVLVTIPGNPIAHAAWRLRMAALDKCEQAWKERERPFPMQGGPPIPWSLARILYAGYSAAYGKEQSIERLAERGGWGWEEVSCMWKDKRGGAKFRDAILAALKGAPK